MRGGSLPEWLDAKRAILGGLSVGEATAVAHRTAKRVYGVRLPGA